MKKQILLAALMLGMGSVVLGQNQLKTYDVSDTNLSGEVTVADVTTVAKQVVTATQGQQMVTAEQLNQVLQMIDSRLAVLEETQGIIHTEKPDASFDQLNQILQMIGFRLNAFEEAYGIISTGIASFAVEKKILRVGETFTQKVITDSDGKIFYSSSNPSVASVDPYTGIVTAFSDGETVIEVSVSATACYPAASASYIVSVDKENFHNGHEYVDLGVLVDGKKVLWAVTNIGAEDSADYGDYFAWGETEKKKGSYDESSYKYYNDRNFYRRGGDISGTDYDVAHVKWQGDWKMPSHKEFEALIEQCDWSRVGKINSNDEVIYGYKVSKKDDNKIWIFLPAAGARYLGNLSENSFGYYWTSYSSDSSSAHRLFFNISSLDYNLTDDVRFRGFSVRPVCVVSE